jgi:hypothetical protein
MRIESRRLVVLVMALAMLVPLSALADPVFYPEPDVDADAVERFEGRGRRSAWLSLSGYANVAGAAAREIGGMALLGMAFDRATVGSVVRPAGTIGGLTLPVTPVVARLAVAAAWRAAGLGVTDDRLDSVASRARWSALLPEVRTRAARLFDESARIDATATGDPKTSDSARANLWLEARLTWRLDRLLYADDEPAFERMRLERSDARGRIASRVLSLLGQWQRAWVESKVTAPDSPESWEAALRSSDAEASLDVMTAGWFTRWLATPEGSALRRTPVHLDP